MIHRYNGTVKHHFGLVSWLCTCEASGAVQYFTTEKAKADYPLHQRVAAVHDCGLCASTTEDPYRHPDFAQDGCEDCYREALPKAELMEDH